MAVSTAPFTILVLSPLCPVASGGQPKTLSVDLASLDEAAAALGPRFTVEVPKDVCPAGEATIAISQIRQFRPDHLAEAAPYLASLRQAADFVGQAAGAGLGAGEIAARIASDWADIPLDLGPAPARAAQAAAQSGGAIDDILSMVASAGSTQAVAEAGELDPSLWKAQIETLTARLLAAVYADAQFRQYEAAWRGLECLAKQAGVKQGGKVRLLVCPATEDTLAETLSALAASLALDIPDLTLVDFPLDTTPPRLALLEAALDYADLLLAPTVCWITERFFGLDSWAAFSKIQYLRHAVDDVAFAKWRKLRDHPAASRLCLMLDRFLGRAAYGPDNAPRPVYFQERDSLWLAPVWALGALCAASAAAYGWPTRFTDYATLALRELPMDPAQGGSVATETRLSDDRIHECVEIGLTPLVGPVGKDIAIVPKEAGLDGGSFAFQLFFSRLIKTLIDLKETAPGGADPATVARDALAGLFPANGQAEPDDLDVAPVTTDDGRLVLQITLTPPKAVLRARQITFQFAW